MSLILVTTVPVPGNQSPQLKRKINQRTCRNFGLIDRDSWSAISCTGMLLGR